MARRHTDRLAKTAEQFVASLHPFVVPKAEQGNWDPMKSLLTIGSRLEGIRLTGAECRLLLQVLNGERRRPLRRGRRRAPEIDIRDYKIALYSLLLELDGEPTEAAVKATEQLFSVNRSTVFRARDRRLAVWAELVPDDPAVRRPLIAAFKSSPTKSAN